MKKSAKRRKKTETAVQHMNRRFKRPGKSGRKPLFASRIAATRAYLKGKEVVDGLEERIIDLNTELEKTRTEMKKLVGNPYFWITQHGVRILPAEMEASHLQNTICFLARKLMSRLGNATWMNDVAFQVEALHHMLTEAKRRGLRV